MDSFLSAYSDQRQWYTNFCMNGTDLMKFAMMNQSLNQLSAQLPQIDLISKLAKDQPQKVIDRVTYRSTTAWASITERLWLRTSTMVRNPSVHLFCLNSVQY